MDKSRKDNDKALWELAAGAAERCLAIDRRMAERVEAAKGGPLPPKDPGEFLDPLVWEHFIKARRDLVDFTATSIDILTRSPGAEPAGSDIERRILGSLREMAELEEKLAAYLTDNLEVLGTAIEDLTKNQAVFTRYAAGAAKPEPGYLSSQA